MKGVPRLPTRSVVFGLLSLAYALYSAFACLLLAIASLGFGTLFALDPEVPTSFGAAFGLFGVAAASIGLVFCAVQFAAGVWILQRRRIGWALGFAGAALSVIGAFGSDFGIEWWNVAWGAFGVWALWTSRAAFRA